MNESTKLLYTTFYTFITCILILLFVDYLYQIHDAHNYNAKNYLMKSPEPFDKVELFDRDVEERM